MRKTGYYEQFLNANHFVPYSLPVENPPLKLDNEMISLYGQAMLELGKLNEMINKLPSLKHFINSYVVKEALLSSAIEGIQTTLLDIYTQPFLESKPNKDTQLVINYIKALATSLKMIKKGMPVSNRVILKAHEVLISDDKSNPGQFRKQSVKVGELIPPPHTKVQDLMSQLENFMNNDDTFPILINAGLAHVQFETIHPFLDGNGRIGRLLIVLMIVENKILTEPILYPSYYFKKNRMEYYYKLDRVRTHGDFEGWVKFYLTAIKDSCQDAYNRAKEIEKLIKDLEEAILSNKKFSKKHDTMIKTLNILFYSPIINISELSIKLNMTYNTAKKVIEDFLDLGFIEHHSKQRSNLYKFKKYWEILEKD